MNNKTFLLGTTIKITTVLTVDTVTTATITIEDPSNVDEVTNANMTKNADGVYSYIWQTTDDNNDGDYKITIKVTYAGYTSISQDKISLVDPDDT